MEQELLKKFFERIVEDPRIGPNHVSLFMALLFQAGRSKKAVTFYILSRHIMPIAKLSSSSTYHRTIHQLHDFGYIVYRPSHDAIYGSEVSLMLE